MTAVLQAELRKLLSRPSARGAFLALVAVGLVGPLLLRISAASGLNLNGEDISSKLDLCAANGVGWALWVRSFALGQGALLLLASQSFAGELGAHTLREELLRPVSRTTVLLAKLLALATWSFASQASAFLLAALAGLILLPSTGEASWGAVASGAAAMFVCEVSFATFALATSVVTRSVAAGIVVTFLFLVLDRVIGYGLIVAGWVVQSVPPELATIPGWVYVALEAGPFLPSGAWSTWQPIANGSMPLWQSVAAVLGWTAAAALVADRTFAKSDIA